MTFMTDTLLADRREFDLPRALYGAVRHRLDLARSRAQLLEMDARMLADVGLDRAAAKAEADKGFWG
jgi:uncharacterized protein YjiS (DUF1127 family)